jgi:C-8 sterol isomerase
MAPQTKPGGLSGWMKTLAIALGVLVPLFYVLDQNLERFYIFKHEALHDLSKRAIAQHGNDTKAMVGYIVGELKGQLPMHVNEDFENESEWWFNNAGGAMGNVFVIHASTRCSFSHSCFAHATAQACAVMAAAGTKTPKSEPALILLLPE